MRKIASRSPQIYYNHVTEYCDVISIRKKIFVYHHCSKCVVFVLITFVLNVKHYLEIKSSNINMLPRDISLHKTLFVTFNNDTIF